LDETANLFDLLRIMNQGRVPDGAVTDHGARPAGLTVVRFETDAKIQTAAQSDANGRIVCVAPSSIEVSVTTRVHRIFVARDLAPPRTCLREVVMEHENRHARINFDCLDDARAAIHAALLRNAGTLGPIEGPNIDRNAANAEFLRKIQPVIREHFAAAVGCARAPRRDGLQRSLSSRLGAFRVARSSRHPGPATAKPSRRSGVHGDDRAYGAMGPGSRCAHPG
jgi:hypothetical protein